MKKKRHTNELYSTYEMNEKVNLNKQQTMGSRNGVSGVLRWERFRVGFV